MSSPITIFTDPFTRANGAVGNGWTDISRVFSNASNRWMSSGTGTLVYDLGAAVNLFAV